MASPPKLPSVADVVSLAVSLHQSGHLKEAEELYSRALERAPDNVDVQHFLGVLRHQQGDSEEALRLIRSALRGNPSYHGARLNLGNVLKESEQFQAAEVEYRKVLEANPDHADALNNLGAVLRALKKTDEAIEAYQRAIKIEPRRADTHQNLGNALKSVGRFEAALTSLRTAVEIDPNQTSAHLSLGRALHAFGRTDEAAIVYRQWLKSDPENPIATHMLAACSGDDVPNRCSEAFVRQSFDTFAASFDEVLERLDYRAPELVEQAIANFLPPPTGKLSVLDAGCGTGLCGTALEPYAQRLIGVDLSPKMLAKAELRNQYDDLHETELVAYMTQHPSEFDLIISADTLIYFGGLDEALGAAAKSLRPGGVLAFTLEHLEDHDDASPFRLHPHGRYSHSESYLRECLRNASLSVHAIERDVLRLESRQPVNGLVVTVFKADTPAG